PCRGTSPPDGAPERPRRRRWLGGSGTRLVTLLEQLKGTPQPTHGGVEHRLADERQLAEQLQGVPQLLAGSLEGGIARRAATALQGAASLGATPAVHHRATLARCAHYGQAPRTGQAVGAGAVGQ